VTDYLQRLSADQRLAKGELREAISGISTALSTMVRDLGLTALTISSLNRAGYSKTPSLDAFKESGSIEFDADLAMILHRPERNNEAPAASSGDIELWIVKNRFGPVTAEPIQVEFDGRLGSFRSSEKKP
jgi:replicative DNA helicase